MEINRVSTSGLNLQLDNTNTGVATKSQERPTVATQKQTEPRIEALHNAMRELPDVEEDKIIAIRKALASGEITTDAATLAKLMMSYHRGNDL